MIKSRFLLAAVLAAATACSSAPPSGGASAGRPRSDSKTITADELSQATQVNLYDYVSAYRPRWLQSRSPSNLRGQGLDVVVFMDDSRLGATSTLKGVSLSGVKLIRYYDASEAQQRFNAREVGAVIQVITDK
jgi:hypothetical protein